MLDELLDLGSSFDWITPVWATVQDLTRGPSYTFLIDADGGCGMTGRGIEKLLQRAGCKTWGAAWVDDTLMISVPAAQALAGWQTLTKAGVTPYSREPARPQAAQRARAGAGPLQELIDWLWNL